MKQQVFYFMTTIKICLLAIFLFMTTHSYCQTIESHGTLIIISASKKGLVIVSDKLITEFHNDDKGKAVDTTHQSTTKIHKINKNAGYCIAGELSGYHKENLLEPPGFIDQTKKLKFDAVNSVDNYFLTHGKFSIDSLMVRDISALIGRGIYQYRMSLGKNFDTWPKKDITQIMIFKWDATNSKFEIVIINIYSTKRFINEDESIEAERRFINYKLGESPIVFTMGQNELFKGISDLTRDEFNIYRSNSNLYRYLNGKRVESKKNIIKAAKYMIRESSRLYFGVGKSLDVAYLDKNGFHWIEQNSTN